jgi:ribonuclease HIII
MAQTTLVLKLEPAEQAELERRLVLGSFEHESVEHARFSVKGEGVVATLYRSGKLVVQGQSPELFAQRFLGRASAEPSATPDRALIGSDETGKGDYFGPFVVAAVRLEAGERDALAKSGVMDSKKLGDETVLRLAPALERRYPHAIEVLEPAEYNREHARVRNLNPILAELHARAIRRLYRPGIEVLVDQFADETLVASRLADLDLKLEQRPRAESEMAVAAASVIARAKFLERLRALSEEFAVDLQKGAGDPTDRAARRFLAIHRFEKLGQVAKLHFKNTEKVRR